MELYLDSVDFKEIEQAASLGILTGLTTTPTFMHRQGITDVDGAIVKLSHMVPLLHIEAIGDTHKEILSEAERLLKLPLACPPVFKVPISNEGIKACVELVKMDQMVNIHLIYTLNQAYMAMLAGATYICPLVGRLHDQGHDAMALIEQCVDMAYKYEFDTKVMVSSVRHADHVRQGILMGAHAVTAPWGVLSKLNDNILTKLGTDQFMEHTRLLTIRVGEVLNGTNPTVTAADPVLDALVRMTEAKTGAISVVDGNGVLVGFFTDGDIRRALKDKGKATLDLKVGDLLNGNAPITVSVDALLYDAVNLFKQKNLDNLAVVQADKPVGILDIQDLVKLGLVG